MKYICPRCNRTSIDGNLWCQDRRCPAEKALEVFDHGEWFGEFEIVRLLTVLRSSAIYEARRGKRSVFLKIAHPDSELCARPSADGRHKPGFEEKLKREATLLLELSKKGQYPVFPQLLPAYEQLPVAQARYGRLVYKGKERIYSVFASSSGELLRNLLLKNAQPTYQQAGWIILSLSEAMLRMHGLNALHLGLHPEIILVRYDRQNIPRPMLLDLGVVAQPSEVGLLWMPEFSLTAYTSPELVRRVGDIGKASDVYGLGVLLYEMLAGRPAFEYRMQKEEAIREFVLNGHVATTGRTDLIGLPEIAEKAIDPAYSKRPANVLAFAQEVKTLLPMGVPAEKRGMVINWRTAGIVIAALMAISLLLAFAVTMTGV